MPGTRGCDFMLVLCCDVPKQGQLPSKPLLAACPSPLGLCWGWEEFRAWSLKPWAERGWPSTFPQEIPWAMEVVTPLMWDKESELYAARSICPVLVGNLLCCREGEYLSARSQGCLCPLLCFAPVAGDSRTTGHAWGLGCPRDTARTCGSSGL